jgi:PAS domain S-box-containing protein
MSVLQLSVISTLAATFVVGCIYFYLYIQYRQRYLGLWIVSWLILLIRLLFFDVPLPVLDANVLLGYEVLLILCSLLLLYGTIQFLEMKFKNGWWVFSVITIVCSGITANLDLPFYAKVLPSCLFIGGIYCWTGVLFINYVQIPGWGKHITGSAFILLGIHALDLPFLITVTGVAPWGFLVDAILRCMIAVGSIIVFFEKTRQDLAIKERHYRLLSENAIDVIFRYRLTPVPGFDYISPSAAKLTGYQPEEFYASEDIFYTLVHPSDQPLLKLFLANVTGEEQPLTLRFIHRNQTIVWIEQTCTPIFNVDGKCIGLEGIFRDISARKALEQDLFRLDRLNTVGQMAASVAHEIRNPMTTIRGYLQIFLSKSEFANYQEQLNLLLDELDRANQIIKEYLSLSQHQLTEFKLISLNSIVEALYPLMQTDALDSNRDIRIDLADTPVLYLDEKEIRQLILNLVRNGLEAMEARGLIVIRTFTDSAEVVLTVTDQGKGIPQHVLDNLGKPFLTTKEYGTGLGLAICYRIANKHQARIEVQTNSNGTTFLIRFKVPQNDEALKV